MLVGLQGAGHVVYTRRSTGWRKRGSRVLKHAWSIGAGIRARYDRSRIDCLLRMGALSLRPSENMALSKTYCRSNSIVRALGKAAEWLGRALDVDSTFPESRPPIPQSRRGL